MKKLETIKICLAGWANQMYARFGCPVYLVGSSLTQEHPRDIDIRIVLPDDVFEARYGPAKEWMQQCWQPVWGEGRQKWAHDVGKLSFDATVATRFNIDFQVHPQMLYDRDFKDKERLRLDTITGTACQIKTNLNMNIREIANKLTIVEELNYNIDTKNSQFTLNLHNTAFNRQISNVFTFNQLELLEELELVTVVDTMLLILRQAVKQMEEKL